MPPTFTWQALFNTWYGLRAYTVSSRSKLARRPLYVETETDSAVSWATHYIGTREHCMKHLELVNAMCHDTLIYLSQIIAFSGHSLSTVSTRQDSWELPRYMQLIDIFSRCIQRSLYITI